MMSLLVDHEHRAVRKGCRAIRAVGVRKVVSWQGWLDYAVGRKGYALQQRLAAQGHGAAAHA